ncbi:DUF2189 domain-containing protein [Methylorubrum extorquens]|uniref:DUF2189 domain-containing protein n=1 Tax=Methylorubrum extorquens TaxID=408 RepID=UPI002237192E|nr:DUF2189 domain-containing protein [Methylorubrum extorquens]UYW26435.1 DUF2189 domain-containing protein [Methylorubrum extorquens]
MATLRTVHQPLVPLRVNARTIGLEDLRTALRKGFADFSAAPTHVMFLVAIYPVVGVLIAAATFESNLIPLLFPLASGFALLGPFAAIGLYEISRRREQNTAIPWSQAYAPLSGRSARAIAVIGLVLMLLFVAWLIVAMGLYWALYGEARQASMVGFLKEVLTTPRGWALILVGNFVGGAFSLIALAISAVSIPLIIDRDADAATAIETSITLVRENPRTMATWGLIVGASLAIGMLPLFIGLAVVLPILGHATWHLYRRAVAS